MGDTTFSVLLNSTVAIETADSEIGFEGEVQAPTFERQVEKAPAALMPARSELYESAIGGQADITHKGYLQSGYAIEPGDRVVLTVCESALSEAAETGDTELAVDDASGFSSGGRVEIGDAELRETTVITDVGAVGISVNEALKYAHEAGETVWMVRWFEVLDVRSWPDLKHHIELGLKAVEM